MDHEPRPLLRLLLMPSALRASRRKTVDSKATPDDVVADRILKAIRRILRRTSEHSRHLSREAGLTATQLLCLRVIGQTGAREEITAAQLTEAIQLTAATVSRILDRLETLGFITRERASDDRRKVHLRATRSGRARLKKLPLPLQERFLQRFDALPVRRRQELLDSLETIVEMMGAEGLDVAPVLASSADEQPIA